MESMSTGKRMGHEALIGRSKHGSHGPSMRRSRREGSAGIGWLLALVLLIIVAGAATWKGLAGVEGGSDQDLAPRATAETVDGAPLLEAAEEAEGPRVVSGVEAGPAGAYASMDRVFEGTGTIFGEVQVEAGVPYPEAWTLTLEPSRVARGKEKAVTRTIQSEPGQRDFQLRDLPMASYRLGVAAEGLVARPQEVALFKLAGYEHMPGVNVVHVTSRLVRVASVEGRIRQASGDMAVDFPVYLIDRKSPNEGRMEVMTDSAGGFKFSDVSSGTPCTPRHRRSPSWSSSRPSRSMRFSCRRSPPSRSRRRTPTGGPSRTWNSWATCAAAGTGRSGPRPTPMAGRPCATSLPAPGESMPRTSWRVCAASWTWPCSPGRPR